MLIWRGLGILVPVIAFGVFLVTQLSVNATYGEYVYNNESWPKLVAACAIAVILAVVGYVVNHKRRRFTVDPVSGARKKAPAHSFFYVPMEFWAIIFPVIAFFMVSQTNATRVDERALIEAPAVNDKYAVDLTKIYTDADKIHKYGVLKVVAVQSDEVEVVVSEGAYNKKQGVRKDLREGKANAERYYSGEPFVIGNEALLELLRTGGIFQVSRGG